ncbi:MAG: 2-oxoglutarate dehydrogenase E1 component [Planctomycetaceae bacterium]|nr:2-oxoglutarate dehydrogenase E1 component [Planctomycetaceae bacterium]
MGNLPIELNAQSLAYVEELYSQYLTNSASVSEEWQRYFAGLKNGDPTPVNWSPRPPFAQRSLFNPPGSPSVSTPQSATDQQFRLARKQERIDQLVRNFRVRGHICAQVDPLGSVRPSPPELDPGYYGFSEEDSQREFSTSWMAGPESRTLQAILMWLKTTYCRTIGAQFMHIDSLQVREWLQHRMEKSGNKIKLSREEQLRILARLADAVVFEEFLAKKFVGAKSFSLDGGETLIPLLDMAIEKLGNDGTREVVIGMAHRGRLNVLANIMGKSPRVIFREFDDADAHLHYGRGDVKYHMGYSSDHVTAKGHSVHLSLCFNPSHLEYVNTVAMGRLRAKMDRFKDFKRQRGACILIHGDAAFAGEGIVQETLNLSELKGYRVGGTIHVILNNQVGFTTSPEEGRSTTYATDVAKMLQIPIFHVNGEDPEAVAQVLTLALDFRKKFKRDVVIDMYCYRRKGHNEADEPEYTQPVMYREIRNHCSVYEGYLEHLLNMKGVSRDEAEKIVDDRRSQLEHELTEARREGFIRCADHWGGIWSGYFGGPATAADHPQTGIPVATAQNLIALQCELPEGFQPHPKIRRLLDQRLEMSRGEAALDWGTAEQLALASVLAEGRPLRMSGQDVRRGTFSHRHAAFYDYETGKVFLPLKNIVSEQGFVNLHNSPLSEAGVLGFEYGYSLDCPEGLVIWEAQFGDFSNCAQVIIDQFIASAEDKWDRLNSVVMLLPHGFEGQGPEHSSARLERFLMLAAEDNLQIAQPTTPAQLFHLLRRQVLRKWRKPLVVMTPKSLLRHKQCVSPLEDIANGGFQSVIGDTTVAPEDVRKILLCTGKVYYDLLDRREQGQHQDVAILRLEELYPFPTGQLDQCLDKYSADIPVVWVQEEPQNMGAWPFLRMRFCHKIIDRHPFSGITRVPSASPATGSARSHKLEQSQILDQAFA